MKKIALFDIDGVLNNSIRFSARYSTKYNVPIETLLPFFKNEFQECLIGKLDLKQQLERVITNWKYDGNVDDLVAFWLEGEVNVNQDVLKVIESLKENDYQVVAGTNQEKYRTDYLREKLSLDRLFKKTYSSAEVGIKKPEKEFYEHIKKDLNVEYSDIVYWDDDEENVMEASKLGIKGYHFVDFNTFKKQVEAEFRIRLYE